MTREVIPNFTPSPSATPWVFPSGLSIEEHALAKRPEIEPLVLLPLDNLTQEQMFSKHANEFQDNLRPESYYGLCGCSLLAMLGNDKLEPFESGIFSPGQKVLVGVKRNGKVIFSTMSELPGTTSGFRVLTTYDTHWVLELAGGVKKIEGNQQVDSFYPGSIFVDGKSLNDIHVYDESYGFQTIHDKPFYFYKRNGKIGVSYAGKEIPLGYDGVPHYHCCSGGELNPRMARNMIAFFAWRGDQWYYVEAGVFDPVNP